MYFKYDQTETDYLKSKCKKLAFVIDTLGPIQRKVDTDLFSSVVHHIVGQQISNKALTTIWHRIEKALGQVNADSVLKAGSVQLQSLGISAKKAAYITDFAHKVKNKELDLKALWDKSDAEVIRELSALKGVGVWTAEMLLLFCMERKDVLSFQDLGIQRGLKMLYHHKKITRSLFQKYRKKFSPFCSVASLYLWAVAGGALQGNEKEQPQKNKEARMQNKIYYKTSYESVLGRLTIACDERENLVGLWIEGQRYFGDTVNAEMIENDTLKVFQKTKKWLDCYFKGDKPEIAALPLAPIGNNFRQRVWRILCEIPYGALMSYGVLAKRVAKELGKSKMSAQAVGGAVGHNPISIIIPCHRVVGGNGHLTGYSGGLKTKIKLLKHEGVKMNDLFVPKHTTASFK
ncbi:MAG: methylated-DNA--[protein]-cysteine S-methyltransferase [Alphaproteobacteria bacterium]